MCTVVITTKRTPGAAEQTGGLDPEEAVGLLLRDLRASQDGLSTAEAQRRILQYGPNELRRRAGLRWPSELAAQLTHPLALLLWAVAGLSFLVFALRGGLIPLPLTVLQLLAFDVGSETLPSLALGREQAEAGSMRRPPRPSAEGVIRPAMVIRAWLFLGVLVAVLELAGFFFVLLSAGWHPGAPVGSGHPLHHAYLEATTMSFVGMIAGQIGTAFAVRAGSGSLRETGVFTNRYLVAAIAGVIVFAGLFVYAPPLQSLLATVALSPRDVLFLLPYPFVVWGADESRRWLVRRRRRHGAALVPGP